MVFSSMFFLWNFLPIVLLLYFFNNKIIKNNKFNNVILLMASLFFYTWGEPRYIILLLNSILINYLFGLLIAKFKKHKRLFLILAIITNLSLLAYYKYFNFLFAILNSILHLSSIRIGNIALPIGLSFYTLQILSYLIDLYYEKINIQKNIITLALYISFFPQLVAGSIISYCDIEKELQERTINLHVFSNGIKRFVYGLGKKVILANTLVFIVDEILKYDFVSLNTFLAWLAIICYTLQIYFDFSGYSDMAIGLGLMFGFHFQENFNLPYISESITEFWRRWHISLGKWFKQYLYIPLGGNRLGMRRTYINLFIVFLATGLWHGASLNFLIWGIYHGIFILLEKAFLLKKLHQNPFKFLNNIYVLLVVIFGFIIFRMENISQSLYFFYLLLSFNFNKSYIALPTFINLKNILIIVISIMLCGPLYKIFNNLKIKDKLKSIYEDKLEIIIIVIILIISIGELVSQDYNPFIYFRF